MTGSTVDTALNTGELTQEHIDNLIEQQKRAAYQQVELQGYNPVDLCDVVEEILTKLVFPDESYIHKSRNAIAKTREQLQAWELVEMVSLDNLPTVDSLAALDAKAIEDASIKSGKTSSK